MTKFRLSAQNYTIFEGDGLDPFARTGGVSLAHLVKTGVRGVLLGHSEVGDAVEIVARKLALVATSKKLPFSTVLIGETWEEYSGKTIAEVVSVNEESLRTIVHAIPNDSVGSLVFGYEPKWGSRGSGRDDQPPPRPEVIIQVCEALRAILIEKYGADVARTIPLLYGGRSSPERAREVMSNGTVSGLILGSACATSEQALAIAFAMSDVQPTAAKVLHLNFKAYELEESYEAYLKALKKLDDSFTIYLSPPYTDLRLVHQLVAHDQ